MCEKIYRPNRRRQRGLFDGGQGNNIYERTREGPANKGEVKEYLGFLA